MTTFEIHFPGFHFDTYRAARVRSLFNAEKSSFDLTANLPADETGWRIGVIVGPSGSGKSSLGRRFWPDVAIADLEAGWDENAPIIEGIAPDSGDTDHFNEATAALAAVGLGSVPAWLRPFRALSNGERFRAGLARIMAERPRRVILDEFTSALDRQVAKIAAAAFAKSWRGAAAGQCLILTCHSDVLDWLEPDWVFDTATGVYDAGRDRRRPRFKLEIFKTGWSYWPLFEKHHYLKLANMVCAKCYVGFIGDAPVCHLGVTTHIKSRGVIEARAARFVVLPEWQGMGIGTAFLRTVCEWNLTGCEFARLPGRPMTSLINTSHPGLIRALLRDRKWRCVSAVLHGGNKRQIAASLHRSAARTGNRCATSASSGYGGHFRGVAGFRYVGRAGLKDETDAGPQT